MDRQELFALLKATDANPSLFYRACNSEEDTLTHMSIDIEGQGVLREGVYAVRTIEDLFPHDSAFFQPENTDFLGGNVLRIIKGTLLACSKTDSLLYDYEVVIKPKKIVDEFDFNDIGKAVYELCGYTSLNSEYGLLI